MLKSLSLLSKPTIGVTLLLTLSGCFQTPSTVKNTTVLTAAVDGSKVVVPEGKTLLFMGQDSDTIAAYQHAIPQDDLEGVTLYTQIKSADPNKTFFGLRETGNWGSGDVNIHNTLNSAPDAALAIGLAFDSCNDVHHDQRIANGEYDKSIDYLAEQLKAMAPRPVFLRIGYEFDGPWNCYQKDTFKRAYTRIATKIRAAGAWNVLNVWHSATWPDPTIAAQRVNDYDHRHPAHLSSWYPGDDIVDWMGLSVFYRDLHQWEQAPVDTPARAQDAFVTFARDHNKFVMIAEAAPQAYRIGALKRAFITHNQQQNVSAFEIWNKWYSPVFQFIENNKDVIKALAYINTHWESQPLWRCDEDKRAGDPECPQGFWGDSRVQANTEIQQQWLNEIHNEQKWVQGKWW